jgi:hypothetical protein
VKDTSPKLQTKFERMIMQRSGEERLKMGCSMHESSRVLIKAVVGDKDPAALKKALFLRFYGDEFGPEERKKILLAIQEASERKRIKAIDIRGASKGTTRKPRRDLTDLAISKTSRPGTVRDETETYGKNHKEIKHSRRIPTRRKPKRSG